MSKPVKCCGPGYPSPMWAYTKGPREKLLYTVSVQPNLDHPQGDYLSTVDVDPESPTFCQVIARTFTNSQGNEMHHSGWNTCSSCHRLSDDAAIPVRDKLVLPCLNSNRIFIVDVGTNPRSPKMHKVIEGEVLEGVDCHAPHTAHCLANGQIMVSVMGDRSDEAKGDFVLLDGQTFELVGTWTTGERKAKCGYDFWYQPHHDVMVASEWSAPKYFKNGFDPATIKDSAQYGRRLNVYQWSTRQLVQEIDLGEEGIAPLEIRFLHDPKSDVGYVGCALFTNVFMFKKKPDSLEFSVKKVISVDAIKCENWMLPEINGMMTDILISLDDRFLYFTCWLQGDVRQYDITDRENPKLVGQCRLGGVFATQPNVKAVDCDVQFKPVVMRKFGDKQLFGGPQMMQLSLDGKRLYVSNSLYSPWDKQFYPEAVKNGGYIVQLDVNTETGGLTLNEDFFVDFSTEPNGPTMPHEMRYPGGDCSSDIWLADE